MDPYINKLHHKLLDIRLPSTIEDLKNPTKEYIVSLITAFFSHFGINMNLIDQPIPEQLIAMPYYEDSDIISLINLYVVMIQIFDKIFLHDFCLTDITNPGQKRFKRQAKFLSNFLIYALHKKSEFHDKMEEIQTMSKQLKELKETKAQIAESINNKIMYKSKQLDMIKKLEDEIKYLQLKTEKLNKEELEYKVMENNIEKENKKIKEIYASTKTTAGNLSKKLTEIQSELVNSPEKYKSSLDKIEKQHKLKIKERDDMQEAIQDKKQSIKQIGEKLNFVQKITEDFSILANMYEEQSNKKEKLNGIRKEIDSLMNVCNISKNKLAKHKDKINTEKNKLQTCHEEDMVSVRNLYSELLREKKIQKTELDKEQECLKEKYLKRNKLQANIKKIEEVIVIHMNACQKAYDNEVNNEIELRKAWKKE